MTVQLLGRRTSPLFREGLLAQLEAAVDRRCIPRKVDAELVFRDIVGTILAICGSDNLRGSP